MFPCKTSKGVYKRFWLLAFLLGIEIAAEAFVQIRIFVLSVFTTE
jgi:hypothetical protein